MRIKVRNVVRRSAMAKYISIKTAKLESSFEDSAGAYVELLIHTATFKADLNTRSFKSTEPVWIRTKLVFDDADGVEFEYSVFDDAELTKPTTRDDCLLLTQFRLISETDVLFLPVGGPLNVPFKQKDLNLESVDIPALDAIRALDESSFNFRFSVAPLGAQLYKKVLVINPTSMPNRHKGGERFEFLVYKSGDSMYPLGMEFFKDVIDPDRVFSSPARKARVLQTRAELEASHKTLFREFFKLADQKKSTSSL